jgi:hypothetical protein
VERDLREVFGARLRSLIVYAAAAVAVERELGLTEESLAQFVPRPAR